MTQPTNTMKTLTLQVTDEQAQQIQKMLGENELPFRPKNGDEVYRLWNDGEISKGEYVETITNKESLSQGNIFPTREAAEMARLRRESAVERYMPKIGEKYKTVDIFGKVNTCTFDGDIFDMLKYYTGMMWPMDTPDSEIEAWLKKYKEAWMFGVKK